MKFDLRDQLLNECAEALTHWIRQYAPEQCNPEYVQDTARFFDEHGGTLYYVAELRQRIKAALAARKEER